MLTPLEAAKSLQCMLNGGKKKRGPKPRFSANQFYPWKAERYLAGELKKWFSRLGTKLLDATMIGYAKDDASDMDNVIVPIDELNSIVDEFFTQVMIKANSSLDDFFKKTIGEQTSAGFTNLDNVKSDFRQHFVDVCKTASTEQKTAISNAVYNYNINPEEGKSLEKIVKEINENYSTTKARFIARNETGTLNAMVQKETQTNAGFQMYEWMAMMDGVTRDTHKNLDGMICRWDDASVYSDDDGKTWKKRKADMYIGHPGMDYNCRCSALPFEEDLLDSEQGKQEEIEEEFEPIDSVDDEEIKEEITEVQYKPYDNFNEAKDEFWRLHFQNKSRYGISNNTWMWDTIWTKLDHTFKEFGQVKEVFGEKWAEYVWKFIKHSEIVGSHIRIKKMEL